MRRVGLMLAALVSASVVTFTGAAPRAEAAPNDVIAIVIEGTGFGHGRGMSQWGAYGWAVDHGWTRDQILNHYYGGTSNGGVDPNAMMSVRLQAMDNQGTVGVVSYAGGVQWGGHTYPSMRAEWTGGGFRVWASTSAQCGSFTDIDLGNGGSGVTFTTPNGDNPAVAPTEMLGVCQPNGSVVQYRGAIEVIVPDGIRVVNRLRTEDYLRGVVPREVAASWADAGGGRGAQAVQAQAVAARSYALAATHRIWAKTCDTTACQAYGGAARRDSVGATPVWLEDYRTDQAIAATAGLIRIWPNGSVVSTEFSASNGPRTAGGAFPVVDDAPGDGTSRNPNHHWTRVIDADTLATQYGIGAITSATMVEAASATYRQYDGIWFNDIVLTGTGGTKRMNAWDFRGAFGLPSPGFTVGVVTRGSTNSSMAYIGDSIGVGIAGAANSPFRTLTDGTFNSATFDSTEGRCTNKVCNGKSSGVSAANSIPTGLDVVVVELGYNDNPSLTAADIDAMMAALNARGTKRVVWVNMAEIRSGPGGTSYYAQSNANLNAARSRWGNLTVADWNQASATPERPRWFASDGVHLTTTGNAKFSMWLRYIAAGPLSGRFAANQRIELQVVGQNVTAADGSVSSIPPEASAVALNVTAVEPDASGYMTVWPCDVSMPVASNVNFVNGSVVANGVIAPLGPSGKVCIYSNQASHLLVDIAGWFGGGVGGDAFVGTIPSRFVDTRNAIGAPKARVEPSAALRVPVIGAAIQRTNGIADVIPAGATAVAVNVTAIQPTGAGYFTVWPCGTPQPVASNVNFVAGATVANGVVAPVGPDGSICIFTNQPADVLVDVLGWFGAGAGTPPFVGAEPWRLVDTRNAIGGPTGRIRPDTPRSVPVRGVGLVVNGVAQAVPADASAVALNVTVAEAGADGYATVWPCGTPRPEASNVNFRRGGTVANGVVAPIGPGGDVCVFTSVDAHLIVDIAGWFSGGNPASFTGNVPVRLVDTRNSIGPGPL
jgi:peptidoglycan hydrolase-like amidase